MIHCTLLSKAGLPGYPVLDRKRYWALPALQQGRSGPRFAAMVICRLHSLDLGGMPGHKTLQATPTFDVDRSSVSSLCGYSGGSSADPKVKTLAAVHQWELNRGRRHLAAAAAMGRTNRGYERQSAQS